MTELDFKAVLARSDLLFDRPALEAAIDRMAQGISERLHGQRPVFVTVLTGGLITAGMLAPRVSVDVDLDFDYVHATRYHGGTSGGELFWKARPRNDLAGRVVLFVDDILDEGHTLEALKKYAVDAGAAAVYIAVLVRTGIGAVRKYRVHASTWGSDSVRNTTGAEGFASLMRAVLP